MKIRYFAWMKDHTGASEEQLEIPSDVNTISDLVSHLRNLSEGHDKALRNMDVVRVAVNQRYASIETPISETDEVAFFPPVTGG